MSIIEAGHIPCRMLLTLSFELGSVDVPDRPRRVSPVTHMRRIQHPHSPTNLLKGSGGSVALSEYIVSDSDPRRTGRDSMGDSPPTYSP